MVHPKQYEKYYLRILLYSVKGARLFNDLKTYINIIYPTQCAKCIARFHAFFPGEAGVHFLVFYSN